MTLSPVAECVMNVSEGRDETCLQTLAQTVVSTPGAFLLDLAADIDHHRCVYTFVGSPEALVQAALALSRKAIELLNLNNHQGVHPRVGVVDVIPFIPLSGVSMSLCIETAQKLGAILGEQLQLPVFLYDQAARPPGRSLAELRQGGLEALHARMKNNHVWKPDFGPTTPHPTAGVVCIGARKFLIAFNMYLSTSNVAVARTVATRIREKDGGLPGVKALGVLIASRGQAQITTNLVDYRQTSLVQLFETTRREVRQLGADLLSSQIVGLAPQNALALDDSVKLQLEKPASESILEDRIRRIWREVNI